MRALLGVTCATIFVSQTGVERLAAQEKTPPAISAEPQSGAVQDKSQTSYRLEVGDVVDIRFFYNDELNTKAQIRPDGNISLPLLGELHISGLTVQGLTDLLLQRYQGTLRKPAVTVQVEGFANRRIFVGGEVARPGVFPLTGQQNLAGALYEAGGITRSANRSEVTVLRRSPSGAVETLSVSLKGLSSRTKAPAVSAAFLLQPLDVIVVHESGVSKANRAVDQYVRQMVPVLMTGGFTYLFNGSFVP